MGVDDYFTNRLKQKMDIEMIDIYNELLMDYKNLCKIFRKGKISKRTFDDAEVNFRYDITNVAQLMNMPQYVYHTDMFIARYGTAPPNKGIFKRERKRKAVNPVIKRGLKIYKKSNKPFVYK